MASEDTRTLHVSKMYAGQYARTDVYAKISKIHSEMKRKFTQISRGKDVPRGSGSAAEAKELQEFFQLIKDASASKFVLDSIEDKAVQSVISSIINMSLKATNNTNGRLFRYVASSREDIATQGLRFEQQLNAVMASTLSLSYGRGGKDLKFAIDKIGLGAAQAGIDEAVKGAIKDAAAEFEKVIDSKNKATFSKCVTVDKDGKIDSSGMAYRGHIIVSPTSYLYKIASLLQKANFTAKSYASQKQKWISAINLKISQKVQSTELTLGSTETARVLLTVFQAHMPPPVALSAYYYVMNTSNNSVKAMASRMRFIYELTGYGQKYSGTHTFMNDILGAEGNALRANYMIYNDPGSPNIYVRSTADIIVELWDEIDKILEKKEIELSKSLFH